MARKPATPPVHQYLNVMVPLYFKDKINGYASLDKQVALSPMAAVCLGAMAIDSTVSPVGIEMLLRPHGLDRTEAAIVSEIGFLELLRDGYVKLASKQDQEAYEARDIGHWGIQAGIHFVITAKGAKRIANLAATMTEQSSEELKVSLPKVTKELAKQYRKKD